MLTKILAITLMICVNLACPEDDEYCASCTLNRCNVCFGSFLDAANGKCVVSETGVDNCLQYVSNGVCKFCQHGYTTTDEGFCTRIEIEDCAEVDEEGDCVMCKKNVKVVEGECLEENECTLENCGYCTNIEGIEQCAICDNDYAIRMVEGDRVCVDENEMTEHCLYENAEGGCSICDLNYYFVKGKCLSSSKVDIAMSSSIGSIFIAVFAFFYF